MGWNQPLGTAGFLAHPRPRKAAGPALRRDEDRGNHRPERTRPDQRSEAEVMFFDHLKAVGAVVAVLSEVLKLETEAVPVSRWSRDREGVVIAGRSIDSSKPLAYARGSSTRRFVGALISR